ncbi:MaoC/PaaZ C-terminal domain-containing protein [Pseudomonas sp. PNP]|uniref:MaoC/PaaZ C-terminal domain-containing protein n=1 Tax=Pseudomonas sp. PNP TaxID=361819 RepID=UPI001AECBB13|nr:MaoC/PaaZ C-terminal domain-containing protein [Pseudomonas sp. PNP]MBP2839277.1 MaoC family dehydratase N-terminal domain-containing protein [Pseudomonas sp. PNP]
MPIDVEKLLSYPIPEVRQSLTRQQTAFYALSVGVGCEPLDERQLRFVDYRRDLQALPSMALVLGHPGFWLGDPQSGVDPKSVVHGEQAITLHADLPVEGDVIGKTEIVGLVDKGEGQGALLYTRKHIHAVDDGRLLASTLSTTFLRGGGGFGGDNTPQGRAHVTPDTAPDFSIDLPTRPEQALYYRMNGDDNPLHADPAVAKAAGFTQPILHGLCTFGVVCHALIRTLGRYDPTSLRSMALRFSSPVLPGETLRSEIWRDGSFRARVVERDALVVSNGLATFA